MENSSFYIKKCKILEKYVLFNAKYVKINGLFFELMENASAIVRVPQANGAV